MANKIQEDIAVIVKISLKEPSKYNVIIHDKAVWIWDSRSLLFIFFT